MKSQGPLLSVKTSKYEEDEANTKKTKQIRNRERDKKWVVEKSRTTWFVDALVPSRLGVPVVGFPIEPLVS